MISLIRNVLNVVKQCQFVAPTSRFHVFASPPVKLLAPLNISVTPPSCGFKVKGRLRRRCKDCYFVRRQERLYIICPTHPRHKQMSMVKDPKNTWILTHATQSKIRPW